ncbi:hypothetical protein V5799_022872, partial [Amblyomma americanum]
MEFHLLFDDDDDDGGIILLILRMKTAVVSESKCRTRPLFSNETGGQYCSPAISSDVKGSHFQYKGVNEGKVYKIRLLNHYY